MLIAFRRRIVRTALLVAQLSWSIIWFWPDKLRARRGGIDLLAFQSRWLHHLCRRLLRVFNIRLHVDGFAPTSGLLVCNHLSYLDIITIAATVPARFVAKGEIRGWPVFGLFARMAGTLFVNRGNRFDVARSKEEIKTALGAGELVVLFPEGTSSSGETVLPFKSALLSSVAGSGHSISAAVLDYSLRDGSVTHDVCYWGDMTLVPHLWNLLGKEQVHGILTISRITDAPANRKDLARTLHAEVARLHETLTLST